MSDLGSRRALILASIFAVAVVSLFRRRGPGSFIELSAVRRRAPGALYFIVKSAVRAGVVAANKAAATPELRTPREILDARYASGEVGREDYEEMRTRLETP